MPGRSIPLITNEVYHIFNRGIDRRPTFLNKREYKRAIQTISYYRFITTGMRLSKFLTLNEERQKKLLKSFNDNGKLVEIIAFCLMPNHFHFLLRQVNDGGISKFLSNFQNSYTRYFNTKQRRDGPLFLDQFKNVRIETEEQLIHVNRYIHLNPYSSYVVRSLEELEKYPWSSLPEYFANEAFCIDNEIVIQSFKNATDYKKFLFDHADYQRTLKMIEHLILE